MNSLKLIFHLSIILLATLSSCSKEGVGKLFTPKSDYERYVDKLTKADIQKTAIGQEWLNAGLRSLDDSILIDLPFKEIGYFPEEKIRAVSYDFLAKRGEVISIKGDWDAHSEGVLFIDLFSENRGKAEHVFSADSTNNILYEVEEDARLCLRIQPEILRGGKYSIEITRNPSLAFPIPGKDSRTVGSFYGVERDGGKRRHEGIDIFVKKGSPVVSVTEGIVTSVRENKLGGKVVFVNDLSRKFSYYYAHLDSQTVAPGKRVKPGDTLGLVGNTGNAKYTPAHLHFAIYTWSAGAIDPLPFVEAAKNNFPAMQGNDKFLSSSASVKAKKAGFFNSGFEKSSFSDRLEKNTIVEVVGVSGKFYRIILPDGRHGYLKVNELQEVKSLKSSVAKSRFAMFERPNSSSSVSDSISINEKYSILGQFNDFYLVSYKNDQGWVDKSLLN